MNFLYDTITLLEFALVIYAIILAVKTYHYFKNKSNFNYDLSRLKHGVLDIKDLLNLSNDEFQYFCGDFIEKQGYSDFKFSNNNFATIKCVKNNCPYLIYCKNSDTKITKNYIKSLLGHSVTEDINNIIILTTGSFSPSSVNYINDLPSTYKVKLFDKDKLLNALNLNYE